MISQGGFALVYLAEVLVKNEEDPEGALITKVVAVKELFEASQITFELKKQFIEEFFNDVMITKQLDFP